MLKLNSIRFFLWGLLTVSLLIYSCKNDDEDTPMSQPTNLATVSNLTATDIGDAGNGSDLQISFSKVADETNVGAYQVFIVKSSESNDFDLAKAETISAGNFITVDKNGSDWSITLTTDSKNTSGELIANDVPYKVFVLTVSSDPALYLNVLSSASVEITLTAAIVAGEKVKVTYIANDGVMIEFEDQKVIIDGMNRASNLSGWVSPTNTAYMAVENGDPPFDDIDIIMVTHNHGDHYSISAIQNYLSNHPNTKLIAPTDVEANFSAFSSQIPNFSVNKFERISLVENDINVDVLHIEHFDQFGNDFSAVESFAYLISMDGKQFLHAGDIDYIDSQLDVFNLLADEVTVAFIPTFGNLVSIENRDALINNVAPENIVCLHFLTSTLSTTLLQVNNIYPGAATFTTPFQALEY